MSRERDELLSRVRHAEDPTRADEERVLRALQAALAAGSEASPSAQRSEQAGAAGKLAAQPGALKVSALIAALVVGVSGAIVWRTSWGPSALPRSESIGGPAAPRAQQPVPGEAPAADAGAALPSEAPAPASGGSAPAEPPALEARGTQAVPEAAPAEARERPARRAANASRAPAGAASLRAELALLERVQAALRRGDGAAALRELDAHRTADRALLAEREAARILALCLVGQVLEARRAAQRFAEQHPNSPQSGAIASSCANSTRIEEP